MRRTLPWMATALLGLLSSASAYALESGFYLGVIGGQTRMDVDEAGVDFNDPRVTNLAYSREDSDSAFGIFAGGQIGRWIAVEAQIIDLGEYRDELTFTSTNYFPTAPRHLDVRGTSKIEAAAAALTGILTLPIGEHFAIGVRLGAAATAAEISYEYVERRGNSVFYSESDSNDAEASDIDVTYGISFEWDPFEHFGVRLDYQRFRNVGAEDDDYDYFEDDDESEHEGADVDFISLSLVGRF